MIVRFDIRPDHDGWTTFDRTTDQPAVVEGVASIGLPFADADELVDHLNTLDLLKGRTIPESSFGWSSRAAWQSYQL